MSIAIDVEVSSLAIDIQRRLAALASEDFQEILESIGSAVESQTRLRLADEKASPDGAPWSPWSTSYARTRTGKHSLLVSEGDLLDSIQYELNGDELEVGSNLVYAATHQFGDRRKAFGKIDVTYPARPFLGLSQQNEKDLTALIEEGLAKLVGGR